MANEMTEEEVRASIVPRSDQINSEDLLTGPITVTVKAVRRGNKEQPINIDLVETEGRAFRPCKTCRRVLIAAWGDDAKHWIGRKMMLFCDKDIVYAGVKVGGVRISHLSDIDGPKTFLLTQTRGKKGEITVLPLATISSEDSAYIAEVLTEIANATSQEVMKALGSVIKLRSKGVQDAVRSAYAARVAELKAAKEVTA